MSKTEFYQVKFKAPIGMTMTVIVSATSTADAKAKIVDMYQVSVENILDVKVSGK